MTNYTATNDPRPIAAPRCTRAKYVALAVVFGPLGLHNFAAGYRSRGLVQLGISVASMGLLSPATAAWALFEAALVKADATGVPFARALSTPADPRPAAKPADGATYRRAA